MRLSNLVTAGAILLTAVLAAPSEITKRIPPRVGTSSFNTKPNGPRPSKPDTKYFHEPGIDDELGHYDARFFKQVLSAEERSDNLQHLIRSYLTVFRERNIETWIAHGTLLGWWWNGKIMPWDRDLDVQVSANTLIWLGANLNMTYHNYTFTSPEGVQENREYLLDVNPNLVDRLRGDAQNVIDARWVDVRNGLFVDITGLSETFPATQPGVWSCKNFHRYRTRDLYPLRETVFEGVPALVPYSFDKVLTDEYSQRALTKTLHEGHRWIPELKEWVNQRKINAANNANGAVKPHVPRSLQADEKPKAGLENLLRVL
jgi:hypothetical protein